MSIRPTRGRGVGTALVRAALASLRGPVERVVSRAYRPDRDALVRLSEAFAAPLGFALASTETVVELSLDTAALPSLETAAGLRDHHLRRRRSGRAA
jgi:methylglyoxal synthase